MARTNEETDVIRTLPNIKNLTYPKNKRRFVASFEIKNKMGIALPFAELEVALKLMKITDQRNLIGVNYGDTFIGKVHGYKLMDQGPLPLIEIEGEIFDDTVASNHAWVKLKNREFEGFSFSGTVDKKTGALKELNGFSLIERFKITVNSGLTEFEEFLNSKKIQYVKGIRKSYDAGTVIEIAGVTIGLINLLIQFRRWLKAKSDSPQVVISVTNNITQITNIINLNSDSENQIRNKIDGEKGGFKEWNK